ncbi:MAG TPA: hypothetical protein VG053_11370 [Solirubrobacteraceae bacterium]|jgi:hypothetical protein|nr:hypothetical protein [Solirubrobacteraceae bacterium]
MTAAILRRWQLVDDAAGIHLSPHPLSDELCLVTKELFECRIQRTSLLVVRVLGDAVPEGLVAKYAVPVDEDAAPPQPWRSAGLVA